MEINDRHVEWAVVDRLSKLLKEPDGRFSVTDTYASFVGVLCWVMQRIRAPGDKPADKAARNLWDELSTQTVEDWGIITRAGIPLEVLPLSTATARDVEPFCWKGRAANNFLVDLRNAMAHGDSRTVEPFNLRVKGRAEVELAGFTFHCEEKKVRKVVWKGSITLLEADMRRIGITLAERYCKALCGDEFARDAAAGVLESGGAKAMRG